MTSIEPTIKQIPKPTFKLRLKQDVVEDVPPSPFKLEPVKKRKALFQKRDDDGNIVDPANMKERCQYGLDNLQCIRTAKHGYPLCSHHLHVVADKAIGKQNLKRSRDSEKDAGNEIKYDDIAF